MRGEQQKRECELENQYNCIKNALDFEKYHNTKGNTLLQ